MRLLRKDLSSGVKNINCNDCWSNEKLGKESLRLNYNNLFKKYANYTEIKNADETDYTSSQPITWDLRLGNLCNIKCVMCSPIFSNKIDEEIKQNSTLIDQHFPKKLISNFDTTNQNWPTTESAKQFLNRVVSNAKWIKLQGGEPFSNKNIRDVIENFNNAILAVTTNGTILDERLYKALSKLPRVEISVSIEAAGVENNIIRYGSDWKNIQENLLRLQKLPNVDIQINHVLQITSVFFLRDVLKFSEDHNMHLHIIKLDYPDYLGISACPKKYVEDMVSSIDKLVITHPKNQYIKVYLENILENTKFDPTLNKQFYEYANLLDQLRSSKFSSILKFKELNK
jgi:organic radical activating enzyme